MGTRLETWDVQRGLWRGIANALVFSALLWGMIAATAWLVLG